MSVLATDFDALLAQRDALQGKLKVAVEALERISNYETQTGVCDTWHESAASEALAQIEGK